MKRFILGLTLVLASVTLFGQIKTINRGNYRPNTVRADSELEAWDKANYNDVYLNSVIITEGDTVNAHNDRLIAIEGDTTTWANASDTTVVHDTRLTAIENDTTTWNNMLQDSLGLIIINSDYGDGVTDATTELDNALIDIAASGGGTILFPPGDYTFDNAVQQVFSTDIKVKIVGYGAKLDFSDVSSYSGNAIFLLSNNSLDNSSMSVVASMDQGDTAITIEDDMSLSVGDVLKIESTDLWHNYSANYIAGEMVVVREVIDDTIVSLSSALVDTYNPDNVTIYKYKYPTIELEGLEIQGDGNGVLIELGNAKDVRVENCKIHGERYAALSIRQCLGGLINNNYMYDAWYEGTGTSYNISVNNSQEIIVQNNRLTEARHNIATGGNGIPSRHIIYKGNRCTTHAKATQASIDFHPNAEFVEIVDNHCYGIAVGCNNVTIKGNTLIYNEAANGEMIQVIPRDSSEYLIITGNKVIDPIPPVSYGISVTPNLHESALTIKTVEIKDNYVNAGCGLIIMPDASDDDGAIIDYLNISGNHFVSTGQNSFFIDQNSSAGLIIRRLNSSNNVYFSQTYDAFDIDAPNIVYDFQSMNDDFICGRDNGYTFNMDQDAMINMRFVNSDFIGRLDSVSADSANNTWFKGSGIVEVIGGKRTYHENIISFGTDPEYVLRKDQYNFNSPESPFDGSTKKVVSYITPSGNKVGSSSATPTANTWATGDRLINSDPSSGEPSEWVNTAGGTPGTWEPVGYIGNQILQDSLGWVIADAATYGDDATDATSYIQDLIDAANDGVIYFPAGVYRITNTLLVEGSPTIMGAGWADEARTGQTTIKQMRNKPVFHFYADDGGGGYGWEYGPSLKDIQLVGVDDADSTEQVGIKFNGGSDVVLERVYISHMGSYGIQFVTQFHTHNMTFDKCKFQANNSDAFYGIGTSSVQLNGISITDCHIVQNHGHGINLIGTNINILDNIIEGNDSSGIYMSMRDLGEVSTSMNGCNIKYNYLENNGGGEIFGEVYWDGASVYQQLLNINITDNYFLSSSTHIDKPGVDHLITFWFANGSTTNESFTDDMRIKDNFYSYNDLGILDAGETFGTTCIVEMPYWRTSGLYTDLGDSGNSEGPTMVIGGETMPFPRYVSGITAGGGVTLSMLYPIVRVALSGAVDITANPQIVDGYSGQIVTFIGGSDSNTLTFDDGNGLSLPGGQCILGQDDILVLRYHIWRDLWVEQYRSEPYFEDITATGYALVGDSLVVDGGFNFGVEGQADDDYEIDIPGITALTTGLKVTFIATTANTDGATLEITGVGDIDAILKRHDTALATGDIEAGQVVECVFDGTNWQVISQLAQ